MPESHEFELPEQLPGSTEELQALEVQAVAAFQTRYSQGVTAPTDVQELEAIAGSIRTLREAIASSQEEGEEEEAPEEEAPAEEAPAEVEEPAVEEAPAEAEASSAAGAVLDAMLLTSNNSTATITPIVEAAPAAPTPGPQSMAASSSNLPPAGVPAEVQLPAQQVAPMQIIASADIPGIPAASAIQGWDGLVAAVGAKARSLPDLRGSKYPVASLLKPYNSDRDLDGISEREAIERMSDMSSPAYLVASGGWCAPSETIYDFACEVEAPPDMLTFPTFTTSRGGARYPISPTFADFKALENNGLFTWTEQDDIDAGESDGPTKPCFHIPCVEFDECRLELEGLCVTAGNLTDRAYPELIRRYLSLVLTAHLHRMNTQKILKALALVDDTVVLPATFAAASALLAGLELQVQDLRDQYSMSENSVIEAAAPRWVRGVIRADIARRECCALETVTNSQIKSYLQDAGIMLQFVSNWQELGDPDNPATVWPTTVDVLLWLPGAIRELTGPTLDIAVARDSVLNSTNDFTVAFTEESYQICKPGCGVRLVTIPICPSGASGERVELICAEESV